MKTLATPTIEGEGPSSQLFVPEKGKLSPMTSGAQCLLPLAEQASGEIQNFLAQKNYPCVAALQSYHRDEYNVGFYRGFGEGRDWKALRNDLLYFMSQVKKTGSPYLTFWAIFPGKQEFIDEAQFEEKMWSELSFLTSEEQKATDWPENLSSNPEDQNFNFCLGGHSFFVVGLHPKSSRLSRRFGQPALIFNLFDQFQTLAREGRYEPMVQLNRKRDVSFQGSANPMALQYGEQWESIQFSGRTNDSDWKCPFQFRKLAEKNPSDF